MRTHSFTITDARDEDGTPYEVAKLAVDNLIDGLEVCQDLIEAAAVLGQNASLQLQIDTRRDIDPEVWRTSAHRKKLLDLSAQLTLYRNDLAVLAKAVSFDPTLPIDG